MANLIRKRRFPRRRFRRPVGLLVDGQYVIGEGIEISEGGMLVIPKIPVPDGKRIILTFLVPEATYCILRGESRYTTPPREDGTTAIGVQFSNVQFDQRRMIRDYISAKTQQEAASEMEGSLKKSK